MYQKENNSWIKHLDFTLIDVLCTLLAFYLAYYLYVEDNFLAEFYKRLSVVVVLLDIVIALFTEAYTGILRRKWKKELMDTIKHYFIVFLALHGTIDDLILHLYFNPFILLIGETLMPRSWRWGALNGSSQNESVNNHREQSGRNVKPLS